MRVDRNAAAVVGDRQDSIGGKLHVYECGMAGDSLVHRIVDDLGEEMMQRLCVGTADIHARPSAHRLESFEHLDVARIVAFAAVPGLCRPSRRGLDDRVRGAARWRAGNGNRLVEIGEKVVVVIHRVL